MKHICNVAKFVGSLSIAASLFGCGGGGGGLGYAGGGYGGGGGNVYVNSFAGGYSGTWSNLNDSTAYGDADIAIDANSNLTGDMYDSVGAALSNLSGTIDNNGNVSGEYDGTDGSVDPMSGTAYFSSSTLVVDVTISDSAGDYAIEFDVNPSNYAQSLKAVKPISHMTLGKTAPKGFVFPKKHVK